MPFTGTVLDHLTKPRPDTRFCTGVLRQTYPAARPPVLPSIPGVAPARSSAPAVMTHPTAAGGPAAAAAAAAATSTPPEGRAAAAGAAGVAGSSPATSSGATGTEPSLATAAQPSTAAQGPEAATQQYEPAFATQRYTLGVLSNAASQQAGAVQMESADQHQGRVMSPVKDEPCITDVPPITAHTAIKQEPGVNAGKQQGQVSDASGPHSAHQAATDTSNDVAASTDPAAAALLTEQQAQQQLQAATAVPVAAPTAGQGPVASSSAAADPWNALDVAWDSDTPPAWPKLVCPWQVRALRRTVLMQPKTF